MSEWKVENKSVESPLSGEIPEGAIGSALDLLRAQANGYFKEALTADEVFSQLRKEFGDSVNPSHITSHCKRVAGMIPERQGIDRQLMIPSTIWPLEGVRFGTSEAQVYNKVEEEMNLPSWQKVFKPAIKFSTPVEILQTKKFDLRGLYLTADLATLVWGWYRYDPDVNPKANPLRIGMTNFMEFVVSPELKDYLINLRGHQNDKRDSAVKRHLSRNRS